VAFWNRASRKSNRAAALDFGGQSYSLGTVSPHFKDYHSYLQAYRLPWVRSCVQVIAYSCANVELTLVDLTAPDDNREPIDKSPFLDLIARPNPFQTGFQLLELLWTDLELTGNAYMSLEAMDGAGRPAELYRLAPDKMTVVPNAKSKVESYKYTVNSRSVEYQPEEMLHFKYPNPLDELYGMGVIEAGEARFDSEMAMAEHERQFWRNGAKITGILQTDQPVDDSTFNRLRDRITGFFRGSGYSTLMLEAGLKYQSVSDGPAKLGMLDMAHASRDMILAMFGVPPTKVGILENANYKAQNSDEFFYGETISPKLTRMEQDLVPLCQRFHPGTNLVPQFERRDFIDDLPVATVSDLMSKSLAWTVNDIRQYQGKDPIDNGDVILVPAGTQTYDPETGEISPTGTAEPPPPRPVVVAPPGTVPPASGTEPPAAGKPPVPGVTPPNSAPVDPVTGEPAKAAHLKLIHTSPNRPATAGLIRRDHLAVSRAAVRKHAPTLRTFFEGQESRVKTKLATFKKQKAALRADALFDDEDEDAKLAEVMAGIHQDGMEKGYAIANKVGVDVQFDLEAPGLAALAGTLAKRVTGINATTKDALDAQVTEGLRRGYSTMQIASGVEDEDYEGVEGVFAQAKGYRSEAIARTETATAYNAAAIDAYKEAEIEEVEVLDGTDDPECDDANGSIWSIDEADDNPTEHPNCLVGSSLVLAPNVRAAFERPFDGEVIVLRTAADDLLTVTANHPILTDGGWRAAGTLSVGDNVVRCLDGERIAQLLDPDHDYVPTMIEQVADALGPSSGGTSTTMPASAEDFHGDGAGSNVYVVRTDGLGVDDRQAASAQHFAERHFGGRAVSTGSLLAEGTARQVLSRAVHSADGGLRGEHAPSPFVEWNATGVQGSRLAARPNQVGVTQPPTDLGRASTDETRYLRGTKAAVDVHFPQNIDAGMFPFLTDRAQEKPMLAEMPEQRGRSEADTGGNRVDSFAGLVASVQLVSVERRQFSGHVYNLETTQGWFVADNIITHNCTRAFAPVLKAKPPLDTKALKAKLKLATELLDKAVSA
jgi:HK97 family phage portal protein